MTWLLKDEPDNPFDRAAWMAWRNEVQRLPATVANRQALLDLADQWLTDLPETQGSDG